MVFGSPCEHLGDGSLVGRCCNVITPQGPLASARPWQLKHGVGGITAQAEGVR